MQSGMTFRLSMLFALLLGLAVPSLAAAAAEKPHDVVQQVTDRLLSDIEVYRREVNTAGDEAERKAKMGEFYDSLTETLLPVVDFNWIALNVMGKHRQQASDEQKKRFVSTFTRSLVETYGRGLLTYSNEKIIVKPPEGDIEGKRRINVVQEIRGQDKTYPLIYNMGQNRSGDWKVLNVIINGINLGTTFRNQFDQAASKYNGDIDRVIDTWSSDPEQSQTK